MTAYVLSLLRYCKFSRRLSMLYNFWYGHRLIPNFVHILFNLSSLTLSSLAAWAAGELNLAPHYDFENDLLGPIEPPIGNKPLYEVGIANEIDPFVDVEPTTTHERVDDGECADVMPEKNDKKRWVKRTFCDSSTVTKEMISSFFHLPINEAVVQLKMGLTTLKVRCRELGISKWPQKKLLRLDDDEVIPTPASSQVIYSTLENTEDYIWDYQYHDFTLPLWDFEGDAQVVQETSNPGIIATDEKPTPKDPWSFEMLSKLFHLPVSQAARKMKVGDVKFKQICRKCGVNRWPYMKLKSMDRLIQSVQTMSKFKKKSNRDERVKDLQMEKERMMRDPRVEFSFETIKIRNSSWRKKRYKYLTKLSYSAHDASSSTTVDVKSEGIN
nr:Protein RKD1 [Ipomoea batatas]GME08949.1 Protein RKD1 [Ipomoea batatas]